MDDSIVSFHWNIAVSDFFSNDMDKALETFQVGFQMRMHFNL